MVSYKRFLIFTWENKCLQQAIKENTHKEKPRKMPPNRHLKPLQLNNKGPIQTNKPRQKNPEISMVYIEVSSQTNVKIT